MTAAIAEPIVLNTFPDFPAFLLAERKRLQRGIDFAPGHGQCWRCRYDLVQHYWHRYPTADITGCPNCNRSFCD